MCGIDVAIHGHIGDDFKAQLEFPMYPPLEKLAHSRRPDETKPLHFLFKFGLRRGAYVEVAGAERRNRPELGRSPTDKDWALQATPVHGLTDLSEKPQGGFEFRAIGRILRHVPRVAGNGGGGNGIYRRPSGQTRRTERTSPSTTRSI